MVIVFICFVLFEIGRWCRREWSSPPDARNAEATRRLYSSVFLGSPGKFEISFFILS